MLKVKFHIYGEDEIIHYKFGEKETKEGVYLPRTVHLLQRMHEKKQFVQAKL